MGTQLPSGQIINSIGDILKMVQEGTANTSEARLWLQLYYDETEGISAENIGKANFLVDFWAKKGFFPTGTTTTVPTGTDTIAGEYGKAVSGLSGASGYVTPGTAGVGLAGGVPGAGGIGGLEDGGWEDTDETDIDPYGDYNPPEDIAEIFSDPNLWQGIYQTAQGIPSAGRSPYESWLANQWQRSASAYELGQIPGVSGVEGLAGGVVGTGPGGAVSYEDYLKPRAGKSVGSVVPRLSGYFQTLTGMDPQAQQEALELTQDYAQPNLFQAALQNRGIPRYLATQMTRQAYAGEPRFRTQQAKQPGYGGGTFLNYLKTKYEL
jgi:hypothetical protein